LSQAEIRGRDQRTEDRRQKTEDRRQKTEDRGSAFVSAVAGLRRGKEVRCHSISKSYNARLFDTLGYETYVPSMSTLSNFVSLHPYFKVQPGKLEAVKAGFSRFVEKTATEKKNLFYAFTINGDEIFCREGYADAEGLLAHLDNVGAPFAEMLTMADLTRVEVHGPAAELGKLKEPLAHLNPAWFTLE
jgi:quinol monooxygenase YgiN